MHAPAAATSSTAGGFRPAGPGARSYGGDAHVVGPPQDSLRAALLDDVRTAARKLGRRSPTVDTRLDWAMHDLAHNVRGDDLPALEVVDFLLSYYGMVEPSPHLLLSRVSEGGESELRARARVEVTEMMRSGTAARVGIGVDREGDTVYVALALQEKHLDLLQPIPRKLPAGGSAPIEARIEPGYSHPSIAITAPNGRVREIPAPLTNGTIRGALVCVADGRYQIEITASASIGPAVLANFPVYCGTAPEPHAPLVARVNRAVTSPEEEERQIVALVNRDRTRAGLAPLAVDSRLTAIARAHSRDMVDHDFVGHVSPRTGNAMDRVRRAGLAPELVMENVGRAYSAEEAENGFLTSPGHRGNLLDPRARRIGVGVLFGPSDAGAVPLIVTQVFTSDL